MFAFVKTWVATNWAVPAIGGVGASRVLASSEEWIGIIEILIAVLLAVFNGLKKKK